MIEKFNSRVYNIDSRKLNEVLNKKIVDVTITSPPYYNLKDYGYQEQIGFGQKYDEYLNDLKKVFKNVFDCTKETGTLWVIIDTFRANGEVVPLPFDFSNNIKDIGWKLQDIIIWTKDKTVPWAHKGQMRNMFEYVLVFSKSKEYNFYIDKIRDFELLKKWWVKYPERYNPNGKTPDGVWQYDIPTQGSWGDGYIKHFCPLPENMIEQILKLTTNEGDIVLDPFAGSGAVLSKADSMRRKFLGFELSVEYITMFNAYLKKTHLKKRKEYDKKNENSIDQNEFKQLNLNLRALKLARVLFCKLSKNNQSKITRIYVELTDRNVKEKNKWCVVSYTFYHQESVVPDELLREINSIISKPPLSKFGIESTYAFTVDLNDILRKLKLKEKVYSYTSKVSHKYKDELYKNNIAELKSSELIISKIKVNLNEKDYE